MDELEMKLHEITGGSSILKIKKGLDSFYSSLTHKIDFLEYLEYEFLAKRKANFQMTLSSLGHIRMVQDFSVYQKQNIVFIEDWIKEKKNEVKPESYLVNDLNQNRISKKLPNKEYPKVNAPVIRRFCELCNDSGLDKKSEEEINEIYCKRICSRFNLSYTDNVRKYFQSNNKPKSTDKHLQKVIKLILPNIKKADRDIIDNYIELR